VAAPSQPNTVTPALGPCRSCGRIFPEQRLQCPDDGVVLPLEGRLLGGKFRLDRRVGDGGMASVWQATNTLVHRTVAIKLMHARYAGDAELLTRFRNEASAAGRIGSPYICDVLDFGESEIGPYIVMELLEGCSLADLIQTHRCLDPGLAVWIVRQALSGLDAAHRAGIVHRDLKPENIFLCRAIRGQWLVKLMDFGISKFAHAAQTEAGVTMGTPHYMAPEQIQRAATVDARADLWSIGVILHEVITGVQLFARDNVADGLAALRGYDPPSIQHYVPEAPAGLAEIVARCLQREPARRFPSATALAQALMPFERPGPRLALDASAAAVPRAATTLRRTNAAPSALSAPLLPPPARKAAAVPADSRRPAPMLPPPSSAARSPSGVHAPLPAASAGRVPSGAYQPVLSSMSPRGPAVARTGPNPSVARTGPQPAVARTGPKPGAPTGPQPAVARTGPKPGAPTGPQPAVARTGPKPGAPTGPQPAVARTGPKPGAPTGPQPAVARTGPKPTVAVAQPGRQALLAVSPARPVPTARSPVPAARSPVPAARSPVADRARSAARADAAPKIWLWGALLALLGGGALLFALLRAQG
jgi:serine/threonine protein kinase